MLEILLKGMLVGFATSIPLGPAGILCIQNTLSKGRNSGLITGSGTAVSDTLYAAIALLGLTFINNFIEKNQDWLLIAAGVIVILFGVNLYLTNPVKQIKRAEEGNKKHFQDFFAGFIMTITNPGAFFLIIGVFAFAGIELGGGDMDNAMAVTLLGVFSGAMTWWFSLSAIINHFRSKFRLKQLILINKIAGIVVMVLGILSLFEGLWREISVLLIR